MHRLDLDYFVAKDTGRDIGIFDYIDNCLLAGAYFVLNSMQDLIRNHFSSDIWKYYAFANDLTFRFDVDGTGRLTNFRNDTTPSSLFELDIVFNERGSRNSLDVLEQLLDDGHIVMVQTVNQLFKFSRFYVENFDLSKYEPRHGFYAIWHDKENVYFAESNMNVKHAVLYQNRRDIVIVGKRDLIPVFEHHCMLGKYKIDSDKFVNLRENVALIASRSVRNYFNDVNDQVGMYGGRNAIVKLIHICDDGYLRLDEEYINAAPFAEALLWYFETVEIRKKLFLRCYQDYLHTYPGLWPGEMVGLIENTVQAWRILRNVIRKQYIAGYYGIGGQIKKSLLKVLETEDRLFSQLKSVS